MKRGHDGTVSADEPATKKAFQDVESIMTEITKLEKDCMKEVTQTQFRFDKLKEPHIKKRGEILKSIPDFWKNVVTKVTWDGILLVHPDEEPMLAYLEDVFLDDNLDENGTHKFTFSFKENPYFKETEFVKEITLPGDDSDDVSVTACSPTMTPQATEILENMDTEEIGSFFDWLCGDKIEEGDFGQAFRHSIWGNPMDIYHAEVVDDEDGEEEEEDDEVGDVGEGEDDE